MDNKLTEAEVAQIYTLGDAGAAKETGLPTSEIRKLRKGGKFAGAYVKTGHRSILYHRGRLRAAINNVFKATA